MLSLLETLVNQDSGSSYKEGVDKIGRMLSEQFQQLPFNITRKPESAVGDHLIISHKNAENPKILIVAHMDTVFGQHTTKERPFTLKDGKAYGPGVIDMKGSHVTLLYALKALLEEDYEDVLKNVVILFNSDEEIGTIASRPLLEELSVGKECCICMEPARMNGELVSARRGGGEYIIKVYGKAAHAGIAPENGANAIEEMAYKIIRLQQLNNLAEGISVNVDVIHGGTATNVIADFVEAKVDIRISKVSQMKEMERKIEAICHEVFVNGTTTKYEGHISRPPMEKNEGTKALLKRIQDVAKEINLSITDVATGGSGDGSFTSALGVPTIDGLGPVGGLAHSKDEYLEINSLPERTLLLAKLLLNLTVHSLKEELV